MILPYMILSPCIFKMRIAGEGSATGAHLSKTVAFDDGRRKRPIKNLQSGRMEDFCSAPRNRNRNRNRNRLAVVLAAEALVVQSVGQERDRSPVAL